MDSPRYPPTLRILNTTGGGRGGRGRGRRRGCPRGARGASSLCGNGLLRPGERGPRSRVGLWRCRLAPTLPSEPSAKPPRVSFEPSQIRMNYRQVTARPGAARASRVRQVRRSLRDHRPQRPESSPTSGRFSSCRERRVNPWWGWCPTGQRPPGDGAGARPGHRRPWWRAACDTRGASPRALRAPWPPCCGQTPHSCRSRPFLLGASPPTHTRLRLPRAFLHAFLPQLLVGSSWTPDRPRLPRPCFPSSADALTAHVLPPRAAEPIRT